MLLMLVLLLMAPHLTACGDVANSVVGTGVVTTGFSSLQWGFSFRYPDRCVRSVLLEGDPRPVGTLFRVVVADPKGKIVRGRALDAFAVVVQEMSHSASPGDLRRYQADFQVIGEELIGEPDGLRMIRPWRLEELGGRQALVIDYGCEVAGQAVVTRAYLVPINNRVYWVTAQASDETSQATDMGVTIDSFSFD